MPAERSSSVSEAAAMRRALGLAARGEGLVEPNPMVGCVVLRDGRVVGEGWHERFGGPHAEVNALRAAGESARGATLVVTLEPCRHTGKTPPCADAVIAAGVRRCVIATRDPFPEVDGGGVRRLVQAGIECVVGVEEAAARELLAPYWKLTTTGSPWVIAKWAMTLDGRIATSGGESQWITGPASRRVVHVLRGRVDAVVVGAGTLSADDPLLSPRPAGERTPLRVVLADDRPLPDQRRLWSTPDQGPVLVAVGANYPRDSAERLRTRGVEVLAAGAADLLAELGRRRLTNVLVEGGGKLLGRWFDSRLVDEVWAFVAPRIVGGAAAPGPVGGAGVGALADALQLANARVDRLGGDLLVRGRLGSD